MGRIEGSVGAVAERLAATSTSTVNSCPAPIVRCSSSWNESGVALQTSHLEPGSVAGGSQAPPTLDSCPCVRRGVLEWEGHVVEGAALCEGVTGQVIT